MKTTRLFAALALVLAATTTVAQVAADDIGFTVRVADDTQLNASDAALLRSKVEQCIAANNAGGTAVTNAFVIEANITVGDVITSETGIKPVTMQQGRLVLIARERVENNVFNTAELPLKVTVTGGKDKALTDLVKSINPKEAALVRFIRNSRTRIAKYYEEHNLPLPYYRKQGQEEVPVTPVDPDEPEEPISYPDEPEQDPVVPSEPEAPQPDDSDFVMDYDRENWNIELMSCTGVRSSNTVKIEFVITNKRSKVNKSVHILHAYTTNGTDCTIWESTSNEKGYSTAYEQEFPQDIPVVRCFVNKSVDSSVDRFLLVEMRMGPSWGDFVSVNIKNLPIKWQ